MITDYGLRLIVAATVRQAWKDAGAGLDESGQTNRCQREARLFLRAHAPDWLAAVGIDTEIPEIDEAQMALPGVEG